MVFIVLPSAVCKLPCSMANIILLSYLFVCRLCPTPFLSAVSYIHQNLQPLLQFASIAETQIGKASRTALQAPEYSELNSSDSDTRSFSCFFSRFFFSYLFPVSTFSSSFARVYARQVENYHSHATPLIWRGRPARPPIVRVSPTGAH